MSDVEIAFQTVEITTKSGLFQEWAKYKAIHSYVMLPNNLRILSMMLDMSWTKLMPRIER